jgi:hypothetical protein
MRDRYWLWVGARLLAGVIVIGWAISYLGAGSGEKEFQKALNAMKQVRSFRAEMTANPANAHTEMLWEVDCNRDLLHYEMHQTISDGPAFDQNWTAVGDREYARQPDGSWNQVGWAYQGNSAKWYCGNLAQGTDTNLLPQIATMIKRGVIQKGDKKTVNGVRCREWLVTLKGAPGGLEHDTVCLGLDDHLPYETTVDWEHSHASFSAFNALPEIDPPETQPASASAEIQ